MIILTDGSNQDYYIDEPQSIVDIERIFGLPPVYITIFEKNVNVYIDSYGVNADEIVIVDDVDDLPPVDIVCCMPEEGDDSDSDDDVAANTGASYSLGKSGRRRRLRMASRHRACLRKSCYRCRRRCPRSHAQETISPECAQILTDMVKGLASFWRLRQKYPNFEVSMLRPNPPSDSSRE